MKVLYLFLLVAGPFCVRAQAWPSVLPAPGFPPANGRPLMGLGPDLAIGDTTLRRHFLLSGPTTVRVMAPDRMPCVVPVRMPADRMPIDRRRNADRMPNLTYLLTN